MTAERFYDTQSLNLLTFQTKRDLITGLKTRTKSGRPDWDQLFKEVKAEGHEKVAVFYCGNPSLSGILSKKSNEFNFSFRKEIF
jgi:hypothetical protein